MNARESAMTSNMAKPESSGVGSTGNMSKRITRSRDRARTRDELALAVLRIKKQGGKLTITAVALEAGLTPALIHNSYPDMAEAIRSQAGKSARQKADVAATRLIDNRKRIKELMAELNKALLNIRQLTSKNETLRQELLLLKEAKAGKIFMLNQK